MFSIFHSKKSSEILFLKRLVYNIGHFRKQQIKFGFCPLCSKWTVFLIDSKNLRETGICFWCNSISRKRLIADVLKRFFNFKIQKKKNEEKINKFIKTNNYESITFKSMFKSIDPLFIYQTEINNPLYYHLKNYNKYYCSEFIPNIKFGKIKHNFRNEDLQHLTFKDDTFDIIITEDVFEHIREPKKAFSEIIRVLKKGGIHLFTIPIDLSIRTRTRINKFNEILINPIIYHGDTLNSKRIKVYTDFGKDIISFLEPFNFRTSIYSRKDKFRGIFSNILVLISIKR